MKDFNLQIMFKKSLMEVREKIIVAEIERKEV